MRHSHKPSPWPRGRPLHRIVLLTEESPGAVAENGAGFRHFGYVPCSQTVPRARKKPMVIRSNRQKVFLGQFLVDKVAVWQTPNALVVRRLTDWGGMAT
jgi:hypothetical protein